jgi:hypothetical protein
MQHPLSRWTAGSRPALRGVRVAESAPPKASHATMMFDLELSSADGVYLELVATADARDVAAFYPTVVHAAGNAPQ